MRRVCRLTTAGWATAFGSGRVSARAATLSTGSAWSNPDRHAALAATYGSHDAGTCGHNFLAWALALRGRSDDANRASEEGVALARRLGHPFSLALTHFFAGAAGYARRDSDVTRTNALAAVDVARQQDWGLVLGWALTLQGWSAGRRSIVSRKAWSRITTGLAEVRATGGYQFVPFLLSLKAHAHLTQGEPAIGLGDC